MDQEMLIKKEYLQRYEKSSRKLKRSEEQIRQLRCKCIGSAIKLDGMPHAHSSTDLSDYAARLDEEERKHNDLVLENLNVWEKIHTAIEQMDNETEKDVLTYRYICLFSWETICEKLGKSWRQVHRIHSRGLQNIKIKSDPGQQA